MAGDADVVLIAEIENDFTISGWEKVLDGKEFFFSLGSSPLNSKQRLKK